MIFELAPFSCTSQAPLKLILTKIDLAIVMYFKTITINFQLNKVLFVRYLQVDALV